MAYKPIHWNDVLWFPGWFLLPHDCYFCSRSLCMGTQLLYNELQLSKFCQQTGVSHIKMGWSVILLLQTNACSCKMCLRRRDTWTYMKNDKKTSVCINVHMLYEKLTWQDSPVVLEGQLHCSTCDRDDVSKKGNWNVLSSSELNTCSTSIWSNARMNSSRVNDEPSLFIQELWRRYEKYCDIEVQHYQPMSHWCAEIVQQLELRKPE